MTEGEKAAYKRGTEEGMIMVLAIKGMPYEFTSGANDYKKIVINEIIGVEDIVGIERVTTE